MRKLILMGGPTGTGSTPQAKKLARRLKYVYIGGSDLNIAELNKAITANPNAKGFVFDGFPQTKTDAEYIINKLLARHKLNLCGVIELMLNKLITPTKRLHEYQLKTLPAMGFLSRETTVFVCQVNNDFDAIHEEIWQMSQALRLLNAPSKLFGKPVLSGFFLLKANIYLAFQGGPFFAFLPTFGYNKYVRFFIGIPPEKPLWQTKLQKRF